MKLKSIISALTASCMIFSSVVSFADEQNKITDNFESYKESVNEGFWATKNPVITEADGNKAAAMGAGTGLQSLYVANNGFTQDVTGLIANFSIKFEGDVKQHVIFGASNSNKDLTGQPNRVLQFYAGGTRLQLCANSSYNISYSYTVDKWYDVSIRLNYNTGYYELLIKDGDKEFSWSKIVPELMRADAAKESVKYYMFWMDKVATQKVLIDNISVCGVTGNVIYPMSTQTDSFSDFTASDSSSVPAGYTTDSALDGQNGFSASQNALNFASASGKTLNLTKTLDKALTPPSVNISLGGAVSSDYSIKLTSESGASEELAVSPDGITFGASSLEYTFEGNENISVTAKDGKLRVAILGENDFAAGEISTELPDLKAFSLISSEDCETDITISSITFATSKYFKRDSSSVESSVVLPNTNKVTLNFSNKLAAGNNGVFEISGGLEVEDAIVNDNSIELVLSDNFSPLSSYTLSYSDVYDTEGAALSGEITFETAMAIESANFAIEASDVGYTLNPTLKSNTGLDTNAVLILTVYDNVSGKIISVDFKNITITASDNTFSCHVPVPDSSDFTVEAYLWDSFADANTLGYSATFGGEQQ